jgi:hypothetical protein
MEDSLAIEALDQFFPYEGDHYKGFMIRHLKFWIGAKNSDHIARNFQ